MHKELKRTVWTVLVQAAATKQIHELQLMQLVLDMFGLKTKQVHPAWIKAGLFSVADNNRQASIEIQAFGTICPTQTHKYIFIVLNHIAPWLTNKKENKVAQISRFKCLGSNILQLSLPESQGDTLFSM